MAAEPLPFAGLGRHFIHVLLLGRAELGEPAAAFAPGEILDDFVVHEGFLEVGAAMVDGVGFLLGGMSGPLEAVGQVLEPGSLSQAFAGGPDGCRGFHHGLGGLAEGFAALALLGLAGTEGALGFGQHGLALVQGHFADVEDALQAVFEAFHWTISASRARVSGMEETSWGRCLRKLRMASIFRRASSMRGLDPAT